MSFASTAKQQDRFAPLQVYWPEIQCPPAFWLLFLADLTLAPHVDDVTLDEKGVEISAFCLATLLFLCMSQTLGLAFNALPRTRPEITIDGESVDLTDTAAYACMIYTTTHRDIFVRYYEAQALAARNIANTSFSGVSRRYLATHLRTHVHRVDQIPPAHVTTPCFGTRTSLPTYGIWPIRYRRASLVLRWLLYVLRNRPPLPLAAVREAWQLAQAGHSSWCGDICLSLLELPVSVLLKLEEMPTLDIVCSAIAQVELSLTRHLLDAMMTSERLPVLQARFCRLVSPIKLSHVCRKRAYLTVTHPKQQEALAGRYSVTDVYAAFAGVDGRSRMKYTLSSSAQTRASRYFAIASFSPSWRVSRGLCPGARRMYDCMPPWDFLDFHLRTNRVLATTAKFVF
ncbi:hypothetical protein K466DRAFT_604922 [Polyporus arcularius HHB13444]|uniref:Uncharacterized protein n=1 Tax=Polyporus arcularius HHB13444 TaxID=1314778 RepID=A0A5C3NUC6_9APHY|nr:hypothetical protein K466DRAFT_604922 [Polyporus arcularius HHB13444]